MKSRLWIGYLGLSLVAMVAYYLAVPDHWKHGIEFVALYTAIGLAASAAIVVGVLVNRPRHKAAWFFFAAGIGLNALGGLAEHLLTPARGDLAFPSFADVLWLSLYPALIIGLFLLIRSRNPVRDWAALVDTTTVTTGLGLLAWIYLIHPAADDPSLSLLGHAVSIAYPVGDVILLAMVVRLLLGGGARSASFALITGSLLLFLAGDTTWAVINYLAIDVTPATANLLSIVFLGAYAAFGAAALHPSMREVATEVPARRPRLSPAVLVLLTTASLIAPVILAVQALNDNITDGLAIAIGCIVLFLLVVARMAQLLSQVEDQSLRLLELARVDELTGLPNRRSLATELPRAIERARRERAPLSVALLDLDRFKRFNDEFGHPAGDRLLQEASIAWKHCLRDVDEIGRYGGEEFVILLPAAEAEQALVVLARLQGVTPERQTFSAGLATWDGAESEDELIARVDLALYEAKRTGRDRIVVWSAGLAASRRSPSQRRRARPITRQLDPTT